MSRVLLNTGVHVHTMLILVISLILRILSHRRLTCRTDHPFDLFIVMQIGVWEGMCGIGGRVLHQLCLSSMVFAYNLSQSATGRVKTQEEGNLDAPYKTCPCMCWPFDHCPLSTWRGRLREDNGWKIDRMDGHVVVGSGLRGDHSSQTCSVLDVPTRYVSWARSILASTHSNVVRR